MWFARIVERAATLFLIVMVAGITGAAAAASASAPGENGHNFSFGGGNEGLLVVSPAAVATYAIPPTVLHLPLLVAVPAGGRAADLVDITVQVQGESLAFSAPARLQPQQQTAAAIVGALEKDKSEAVAVVRAAWYKNLAIDLRNLQLKEGDVVPIRVTAHASIDGSPVAVELSLQYSVLALPVRDNWYGGDGHVHTAWSPDMWEESIDERAAYAASNGHKWIAITDHEDGINNLWSTQNGYVAQCNSAQTNRGIPVCPGAEIATTVDSHCLGYALKESAATIPDNEALAPQALIDAINNHNPPSSYAIIAHPYGFYPWGDANWGVTGFRGIELLCQETSANSATINKWFELLRNGLSSTISTGKFVVGIGTSDCHVFQAPGFRGFTWVYTTSYGSSNRTAIWDAVRAGRVSASGLKDLGCFALNNYPQGSVINTTPGSTLTFKLVQQPVTGRKCTKITIYNLNQGEVNSFPNPSGTETTWSTTAPSADGFYVVKSDFTTTSGSSPSQVWANPIFINVP